MKYEAVVFDLDGTLLDTLDDLAESVNYIMKKYGYDEKTVTQVREYVGNGAARLMELCLPDGKKNNRFLEILSEFKNYYGKNCVAKTKPYPGIKDTLRALYDRGVKMSVVSNKPDSAVKDLCALFFADYISVALGEAGDDTKKPCPKLVLSALEQMGVSRDKAVYIGDSEVDILTAKNAQMDCICVSWGFRGADFLKKLGAERIIDKPCQILDYI